MGEFNRYWAEEALDEPYIPQDYSWMSSTRRVGMILGGVTCVLTTSSLLGTAVYHLVERSPRVAILAYEIEMARPTAIAIVPAPSPSKTSNKILVVPDKADTHRVPSGVTLEELSPRNNPPVPPQVRETAPPTLKPRVAAEPPLPATATSRAAAPALRERPPAVPESLPQAQVADAAPMPKLEPGTKIGLSKAADGKPTDIASGEKLGIREILADGIVMQNGRRIKNGSPLPNGEILIGTDAAKGMAETDRRLLVLTP